MVGMTAPGALVRYGMLEERCSLRGRRKIRMGGRGSGRHGEAW